MYVAAFERHEVLMAILREDLFVAFFTAARSSNLATLSNVCQVALSLYAHLGSHLLLQVRARLGCPVSSFGIPANLHGVSTCSLQGA